MTARIVYALLREEAMDAVALEDSATMPQAAENSRRDIRGQLWQRLAERDAQTGLTSPPRESLAILRGSDPRNDPNQRVRMFGRYQKLAAGRIRAGVRVK